MTFNSVGQGKFKSSEVVFEIPAEKIRLIWYQATMMILKMFPRWFIHTTIASGNGKALVKKKKYKNDMNRTVKVFIQSEKA